MPRVSMAEVGGDVRERRARADPELADRRVRVELLGVAAGALAEVERWRRGRRRRLEHEHRARLGVGAPAREVGERGVRAERVVGVVRPLLRVACGDDEPLARGTPPRRVARRAAANAACSRAGGRVSSRSAQPLPMNVLERPRSPAWSSDSRCRPDSSEAGGAVVVLVSLVLAMSSILAPLRRRVESVAHDAGGGRCPSRRPRRRPGTRRPASPASRARGRWGCRAARGASVGQVPTPPLPVRPRRIAAAPEVAAVDAATGEVVDGRVEVARHDHVLAGALLGEPVEVAPPVAQLPADRSPLSAR